MTIEKRAVETATCDACGAGQWVDIGGDFESGFELTIKDYADGSTHAAWACKESHAGKAIRVVLAAFRAQQADNAKWDKAEAAWHEDRAAKKADRELSITSTAASER